MTLISKGPRPRSLRLCNHESMDNWVHLRRYGNIWSGRRLSQGVNSLMARLLTIRLPNDWVNAKKIRGNLCSLPFVNPLQVMPACPRKEKRGP